ncbi:MAG: helix-turn-helix transcriptional regulator [Streptosporangiales bacterium]|nr:helix-turn-helix transcriptional regulator [Streptosporangiales bacterium]
MLRAEREGRALSQTTLAEMAGVSSTTISQLELGRRASTLDLVDRVLRSMGLRLHLETEPQFADVDDVIRQGAGRPLTDVVAGWGTDAAAYFSLFDGIPFVVEGAAAAALQGVPVPVETLEIAVAADDEEALERMTFMLEAIGAGRGDYENRDLRIPGSPDYRSMHGPVRIRLASPFEQVCWVDIDPLPEPTFSLTLFLREKIEPLPRARVGVTPLFSLETADGQLQRVIQRSRELLTGDRA